MLAPTADPLETIIDAGIGQFAVIQAMAPPSLGVELSPIDERDGSEIERDIAAFARAPNGGLIVTGESRGQWPTAN